MSEGLMIFLCIVNMLVLGFILGQKSVERKEKKVESSPVDTLSEEELERIRKEREELKAEHEAFLKLMGYNADIAYGLGKDSLHPGS